MMKMREKQDEKQKIAKKTAFYAGAEIKRKER